MTQNERINITLKAGTGYDAPWVVLHADTPAEAENLVGWAQDSGFLTLVAGAAKAFHAQYLLNQGLDTQPVGSVAPTTPAWEPAVPPPVAPPVGAVEYGGGGYAATGVPQVNPYAQPAPVVPVAPPAATTPPAGGGGGNCAHGQRVYKAGVSNKTGKPYAMWACPANVRECKAEWINTN